MTIEIHYDDTAGTARSKTKDNSNLAFRRVRRARRG
jgi:hypothetical protein